MGINNASMVTRTKVTKFLLLNHLGVNLILRISNNFTEQYIILKRTEEGHEKDYANLNFSLQNSCTPQVNDIRTANVHNRHS